MFGFGLTVGIGLFIVGIIVSIWAFFTCIMSFFGSAFSEDENDDDISLENDDTDDVE